MDTHLVVLEPHIIDQLFSAIAPLRVGAGLERSTRENSEKSVQQLRQMFAEKDAEIQKLSEQLAKVTEELSVTQTTLADMVDKKK